MTIYIFVQQPSLGMCLRHGNVSADSQYAVARMNHAETEKFIAVLIGAIIILHAHVSTFSVFALFDAALEKGWRYFKWKWRVTSVNYAPEPLNSKKILDFRRRPHNIPLQTKVDTVVLHQNFQTKLLRISLRAKRRMVS